MPFIYLNQLLLETELKTFTQMHHPEVGIVSLLYKFPSSENEVPNKNYLKRIDFSFSEITTESIVPIHLFILRHAMSLALRW